MVLTEQVLRSTSKSPPNNEIVETDGEFAWYNIVGTCSTAIISKIEQIKITS